MQDDIHRAVLDRSEDLVALRRKLHGTPELGFKETATAEIIADRLDAAGLNVRTGVGRTGVVGVLEGARPGPTLMIRADIDGLPIDEKTGLDFASRNGAMHACGHDGHITMAVGAADILAAAKEKLSGRVVFVFQPAEEIVDGARAMIAEGLLDAEKPDRVIGTHLWNQVPIGRVAVNRGTVFASADGFRLTVTGKGGHGAMPHLTVDPVVAMAQMITTAQTVVSREVPPNDMGVLTFGQIHGGTASNIIPDAVTVEGTIRAYRPEVREQIFAAVKRVALGVAESMRTEASFEHLFGTPPTVNNPEVAAWTARHAAAVVGEDAVGEWEPVSVGDDMAEFLNRVPGTYFLLGASKEGTEPHHNARFDFDERCLPIGTEIFVRAALDFLA